MKKKIQPRELGGFSLRREIDAQIQSKRGFEPGLLGALHHLSPNQLS
jgi:hypothetical protein